MIATRNPKNSLPEFPRKIFAGLKFRDLEFWVANGTLQLESDINNQVTVLSETLISVLLPEQSVIKKLKTIIAQVGDSSYLLKINKNKGKYQATISAPKEIGKYPIVVLMIIYEDGTKDTVRGNLVVKDYGTVLGLPQGSGQYVFAGTNSKELDLVKITLFEENFLGGEEDWQVWSGEKYYQNNPQITNEQGEYGYMVSNGKYYMVLEKNGYKKSITPVFEIQDNTINWDLHLERVFFQRWYEKIEYWLVIGLLFLIILFWKRKKDKEKSEDKKRRMLQESL